MRKELCIDARMGGYSGIGTYLRNLVNFFKEGPFKLRLIVQEDLISVWPDLINFDLILIKAPIYSIAEQFQLPRKIPFCDLFWSPHYNVPVAPIRSKKRILTLCDARHLIKDVAFLGKLRIDKKLYANFMIPYALKRSDLIVTVSYFSQQEISQYTKTDPSKIHVIHLGVDKKLFDQEKFSDKEGSSTKLPKNFFLFVGNLFPSKNVYRLLSAWRRVIQQYPDWKLVIVGKETPQNEWKTLLERDSFLEDHVVLIGQVCDTALSQIYSQAYASVYPSLYEGFGLIPLESMSCSKPVVCSNVASLPEVCGDCVVYIDPYDEEDIARGMKKLISNPVLYQELSRKGLEWIKQFSWDRTAQKHIELFESIL